VEVEASARVAIQNSFVLVTQTRRLQAEGRGLFDVVREGIGRVRPRLMTAATAILGLLPLLVLQLHRTEIERPPGIVMIGGLVTSTLFTRLVPPALDLAVTRNSGAKEAA
jgi:heavy metal efflux system protein